MSMIGGHGKIDVGVRLLLAAAVVIGSRYLLPTTGDPAAAASGILVYGCAAIAAALLFLGGRNSPPERALQEACWATALAGSIVLLDPLTRPLAGSLAEFLLTLFLLCASAAVSARILGTSATLVLFALLTLAPVWAGPLVESAGNPAWLNAAVVGCSPLTALATALDFDYLRTVWFYSHSPLGSMRYAYPAWSTTLVCLSVLPAAAVALGLRSAGLHTSVRFTREAHP